MSADTTTRDRQRCPEWCEGTDHVELADQFENSVPEHFTDVGGGFGFDVVLKEPMDGQHRRRVEVTEYKSGTRIEMTSVVARSLAAWLVRAADKSEMDR